MRLDRPRFLSTAAALAALTLLAAPRAEAGKRHTVWAYPPGAGPKGNVEVETWITTERASSDSGTDAEYRLEIENGLADGLSLDVYLAVLKQPAGESLTFDAVQAALRADLFRDAFTAIDLTGYFEVKRDIDFSNPWEFEAILIGGKAYGRFDYDFNLVYEGELSSNAFEKEHREIKGILGAGYEITTSFWAGGEFVAADDEGEKEVSIGPTISVGLTDRSWIAVGAQFGLSHDTDDLKVRALFGLFF